MTVNETAASLDMTAMGVRQAIRRGKLAATKRGRDWDVASAEVERYRAEHRYATTRKAEA